MDTITSSATPTRPRLAAPILIGLALLAMLLGAYQWWELYSMRVSGVAPSCAVSENVDCASVWNSPLAGLAHKYTGLPFAGWGVVWGAVVLALAVTLASRIRRGESDGDIVSALRITTAVGGLLSIGLLIYSLSIRVVCPTCILFYVLVAATVYLAFARLRTEKAQWTGGAVHSIGWLLVAFGALLYPGLHTPKQDSASVLLNKLPGPPAGKTDLSNDPLANFIQGLTPEMQQILSDTRAIYRTAPSIPAAVDRHRLSYGDAKAAVHLIDWVDIRCPHCRNLELALHEIRNATPPESWAEESRHFPLDGECNPNIKRSEGNGVACLAAKLLICLAGSPRGNIVRSALFDHQRTLSVDRIWEIAAPDPQQRATLESCVAAPDTAAALRHDIELAVKYDIEGTPLVVINGRAAPAFPPLIYAMIIAGGDGNAAGFRVLPPPRPEALEK